MSHQRLYGGVGMRRQKLYGGVRLLGEGPSPLNIARLDAGAIPMTHAMQQRGLQVDLSHFARMERVLTDDMERITEEVHQTLGVYVNLDSGDQVSHLLFKTLGLKQPRPKMTPSGSRESVEHEVLVSLQHEHPIVASLLNYKELSKLRGTYVTPMPKLARRTAQGVWRMFPHLSTTRTPSGRYACQEPNLLAMPNRTPRGREVCAGFITDPGFCFLSVDESQIEPRTVAHRSQDAALMAVYEQGEDIYSDFAISAFRLPDRRYRDADGWHYPGVDKKLHRFPSKTCILASIYRVTNVGLLEQMPVVCQHCYVEASEHEGGACRRFKALWTEDNCQDLINAFYARYPGIVPMQRRDDARARKYGYIWDDFGRLMHTAAVRSVLKWVVAAALREAGNMPIQCLPAQTMILTSQGYTPIGDFTSGMVWTGERLAQATRVRKGIGELVRVHISDGADFVCDTSHRILTQRSAWPEWVGVLDLQPGDLLPPCLTIIKGGNSTADPEFWYWVGRYFGDGHITYTVRNSEIALAFGTDEWADVNRFRSYVKSRGHSLPRVDEQHRRGGGEAIRVASHTFHKEMMSLGVIPNEHSWSKRIPSVFFSLDYERRIQLLKGYYDADGNGEPRYYEKKRMWTQRNITSVNLGLLQDTQLLYRSCGISTRVMGPYHNRDGHRDFYRLVLDDSPKPRRIHAVDKLGISAPVYTLRVSDPRHAFDSEGLISKNSFACGTLKLTMAAVHDDLQSSGLAEVAHPLLPVHDELLFECREDVAEELGAHIAYRFSTCVELSVPLRAEWVTGQTWGAVKS